MKTKFKKRKYKQIQTEPDKKLEENEKAKITGKIVLNKCPLDRYLKKDDRYYYKDENNLEWQFREKEGSNENYYFVCTSTKCNAFGMISRTDEKKKFLMYINYI